jgi:hypothetical protein
VEYERNLNQEIAVVERVIFYDPQTGEIVGSHSFGSSGAISEAARQRLETLVRNQLEALEKQHSRKLAILRSAEAAKLTSLHHSVDLSTGRLVELPHGPTRIIVQ